MDFGKKLNNCWKIKGIVKNTFRPQKTLKTTRIKLYNTLVFPASLYSSENLTINAQDGRRITAYYIKYVRKAAGYTWTDYKTNSETAKELNITPVLDKIQDYRKKLDTKCKRNAS